MLCLFFSKRYPVTNGLQLYVAISGNFLTLDGAVATVIAFGDGVHQIDAKGTAPQD